MPPTSNPHINTACLCHEYEAFLCSLQCGGCGKRMAWPVMGLSSHQQMHAEPPGRAVGCSHCSRQHHGDRSAPRRRHIRLRSSEAGQREHGSAGHHSWKLVWVSVSWWLSRPTAPSWGACPAGCARPTPLRRPPPLAPRRRARGRSWFGSSPS
jgi:hypothetical protein